MSTKEQERKALAEIQKIVASLGEDSYIAMAFDGCFEIASENIENDFGCSMKQRAEKAEEKAAYFKRAAEVYAANEEEARAERDEIRSELGRYKAASLSATLKESLTRMLNLQIQKCERKSMDVLSDLADAEPGDFERLQQKAGSLMNDMKEYTDMFVAVQKVEAIE